MSTNHRRFTQLTILSTFLAISGWACSSSDANTGSGTTTPAGVIPAVEAVQARYGSLPLVERFSGNVRAENQVPLYAQINAKVAEVLAENGDFVVKGQILVRLEDETFQQQLTQAKAGLRINQARLRQAEAGLSQLQGEFNREQKLNEQSLSSEVRIEELQAELISLDADVELAKAQVEQSEALVAEREETLSRTIIRAPISGTIGQRNVQIGMQVSPNNPLFLIGDLDRLRIEVVLTESMLNTISVGQRADILVPNGPDGTPQIIEATLSRISPFLNEVTRSTEAEIDLEDANGLLRPGMFIPVDVHFGDSQQATLIPTSALYTNPNTGTEGVYLAPNAGSEIPLSIQDESLSLPTGVQFIPITVLARGRMEVGVTGIESGDWIISLGQDLLSEGREQARLKAVSWDHVTQLQSMQREDLLEQVMKEASEAKNNKPETTE